MDIENPVTPSRKPTQPLDPIGTVLRHWLKIIVFGGILMVLLSPIPMLKSRPYYVSAAKIRVSPVLLTFIRRSEEAPIINYYADYVRTQVDRIKDLDILEKALATLDPAHKPIFAPKGISISLAARNLQKRLNAVHLGGTHLILLNLSGDTPDGLAEVINAIISVYLEKVREEEEGKDFRRLAYLQKEKDLIQTEIQHKTDLFTQISREIGSSTFDELYNIHHTKFGKLQEKYVQAYIQRIEKENFLNAEKEKAERLKQVPLDALVDELVEQNQATWQIDFYTYKTLQELRASLDGLAADNPDRKYVESRMAGMRTYLTQLKNDVRQNAERIVHDKRQVE
ncbi:hypothetical protein QUF70_19490, partial [Desulfobacterales bacterium HSG17]|nr:hypothetical protein [Desulfobacterales bacterium HSG17]